MTNFYLDAFQVNLGQPFPPQFLENVNPCSRLLYMLLPIRLSCLPVKTATLMHPNQQGEIFDIVSMPFGTLAKENFTEIVPGEPLRQGS